MAKGMFEDFEILETIRMFQEEHLDVRTITMGISRSMAGRRSAWLVTVMTR